MGKWKNKSKSVSNAHPIEASFEKLYSAEESSLIKTYDVEKLKLIVAEQNAYVMKVKSEMEANAEYQLAKQKIDDLRGAFNDTKKYSDAKKLLCLYILQQKGIVDCGADEGL